MTYILVIAIILSGLYRAHLHQDRYIREYRVAPDSTEQEIRINKNKLWYKQKGIL